MKFWISLIIISISILNNVYSHPALNARRALCQYYVFMGDKYYQDSKYDSALIAYSVPYYLIVGINPGSIDSKEILMSTKHPNTYQYIDLNLKIGKVFYHLGEYENSIQYLKTLWGYSDISSNFQGNRHYYLGMAYNKTYRYQESLLHYFQSLDYYNKIKHGSSATVGLIYCDIGNVYYNLENYNKAQEYYNSSYRILKNQKEINVSKLSIIKNNIGSIHYRTGSIDSAICKYKEAIKLINLGDINPYDFSMYLNNLAGIYLSINEIDSAEIYYLKSLHIRKDSILNNLLLSQTHNQMGLLYLLAHENEKSLHHFHKAIMHNSINYNDTSIFSVPSLFDIKDFMLFGISLYYKAIALNDLYQNNPEENQQYIDAAYLMLNYLQSFFEYVYINETRVEYLEDYISFNREVINTSLDIFNTNDYIGNDDWYTLFQRGKSVLLYQNFLDSKAKKFADIPTHLIKKEKSLQNDISMYDNLVNSSVENGMDFTNFEGFLAIVKQRNNKVKSLDSIIHIFEQTYPNYYQIKYNFKAIPLCQFQNKIKNREAVIEYHIADSNIYSICISKDCFIIHSQKTDSIPEIINQHMRNIKFYDNHQLLKSGTYLYNRLISPFQNILQNCKKVTIIPDQDLSLFPFETLIRIKNSEQDGHSYLIEDMEISYHFSTSLWYEKGSESDTTQHSLFACAPYRLKNTNGATIDRQFSSLPFSAKEVLAIKQIFEERALNNMCLIDKDASKKAFGENAPNYSIIHLSTHNIYYKTQPEISGILFYNDSINSNLLSIDETYNLILNAKLVVLSACMTGVGKLIIGEGAITLYRGFFYSGASNIIFTLWNAPDRFTSDFMVTFYNNIFEGYQYSSALRKTKISFIQNKKTALPVFWSNFLILGN